MQPTQRKPAVRPLLLASAGLGVLQIACGVFISGNLIVPPCEEDPSSPYCPDAGVDAGSDAGADAGTDGGP